MQFFSFANLLLRSKVHTSNKKCFFRDIANEEVNHLFAASDDDHDEVLTFDEILDKHDIFVGSEATDYGEHLHNIHYFQDEL